MYLKLATTNIQGEEEEGGGKEKEDKEEEKDALVFVLALVPVLFPVFCFGRA